MKSVSEKITSALIVTSFEPQIKLTPNLNDRIVVMLALFID